MNEVKNTDAITAFVEAQANMGKAIKNQKNAFLNNTDADLSAIQDAIIPAFASKGLAIIQECGADEHGKFVKTSAVHTSGYLFTSTVYLEYKKSDMQSLGGAITYARRYGLASLTGVPVQDDDGNKAVGEDRMQIKKDLKEKSITPKQASVLERAIKLERMLPTMDADALLKFGKEAQNIIDNIKTFNEERSAELEVQWQSREAELEIN